MVAERVVDLLEVVEVDQHHGGDAIGAAAGVEHLLDAVAEQRAVRQAGERVVQRLVLLGDRLAAAAVDGEQRQEQQRHRRQREVGGEGDHRREAEHQAAGRDLEEPVLDEVAADPQLPWTSAMTVATSAELTTKKTDAAARMPGRSSGREVELGAHARDAGEEVQRHARRR